MPKRIDLKGQTFGRLKVFDSTYIKNKHRYWTCQCECGKIIDICGQSLRNGSTKSCRCIQKVWISHRWERTHSAWCGAIYRCSDKKSLWYRRGITVCDRWKRNFYSFANDMGVCPEGLTLDRIDNDGNYEPGNCRWATWKEQENNRSNTIYSIYKNKKLPLMEFLREVGLRKYHDNFRYLVEGKGMNFEEALQSFKERRAP